MDVKDWPLEQRLRILEAAETNPELEDLARMINAVTNDVPPPDTENEGGAAGRK